jgi:hypothetical protein
VDFDMREILEGRVRAWSVKEIVARREEVIRDGWGTAKEVESWYPDDMVVHCHLKRSEWGKYGLSDDDRRALQSLYARHNAEPSQPVDDAVSDDEIDSMLDELEAA